jgi:hypothetical protein
MGEFRYIGLAALEAKARRAVLRAVKDSANDLLKQVVPATPIEEGTLRGSEQVGELQVHGNWVEIKLFTGGESSDYAIPVHERDDASHAQGQAHFIEEPLIRNKPLYQEAMRRAARGEF